MQLRIPKQRRALQTPEALIEIVIVAFLGSLDERGHNWQLQIRESASMLLAPHVTDDAELAGARRELPRPSS